MTKRSSTESLFFVLGVIFVVLATWVSLRLGLSEGKRLGLLIFALLATFVTWLMWSIDILRGGIWKVFVISLLATLGIRVIFQLDVLFQLIFWGLLFASIIWVFWEWGIWLSVPGAQLKFKTEKRFHEKPKQRNNRSKKHHVNQNSSLMTTPSAVQHNPSTRDIAKEKVKDYQSRSQSEQRSKLEMSPHKSENVNDVADEKIAASLEDVDMQIPYAQEDIFASQNRGATSARENVSSSPLETFRRSYNAGVEDQSERQSFRERYSPIRVGTANAMQRRRDINIPPEFQTANDGDYYAVLVEGSGSKQYAVVPRFDLTFQESSYGPGAMGIVFDCPGYNSQMRYRKVRVDRPAIFERHLEDRWTLDEKNKGQLELGQVEP